MREGVRICCRFRSSSEVERKSFLLRREKKNTTSKEKLRTSQIALSLVSRVSCYLYHDTANARTLMRYRRTSMWSTSPFLAATGATRAARDDDDEGTTATAAGARRARRASRADDIGLFFLL